MIFNCFFDFSADRPITTVSSEKALYFATSINFYPFVANYELYFATNDIFITFVAKYKTISL